MESLAALRGDYKKDKDSIASIDFWDLLEGKYVRRKRIEELHSP